jgi:hypothetical protein
MAHVVPEMATCSERIRRKLADLSQTASRGMDAASVEGTFPLLTMGNRDSVYLRLLYISGRICFGFKRRFCENDPTLAQSERDELNNTASIEP